MILESEETHRNFIFTEKELKEKLGLKGHIKCVNLCKGLSPNEIEEGKDCDCCEWEIQTTQSSGDKNK